MEQWLLEDQERPKKQRHTADKIYERLVEEYNYQGSKASVHMLVHKLRQKERETYIPLSFEPGTNAQCDWGTVTVILAGEPVKVELFAIRLTNSRLSFCQVFPSQRQEAFFEGHRRAFEFFGGVPLTITYDNLKTAVSSSFGGYDGCSMGDRRHQKKTTARCFKKRNCLSTAFCSLYSFSTSRSGYFSASIRLVISTGRKPNKK